MVLFLLFSRSRVEHPVITTHPVKMRFPLEVHGLETIGILENAMVIAIIVQTIMAIAMADGIMVMVISMAVSVVAMVEQPGKHIVIEEMRTMARRKYTKYDKNTLNTVVMIMLFIFLMPIAGIKMLGSESVVSKVIGGILVVLGIIIWIKLATG